MKKLMLGIVALAMMCGSGLRAQDLTGNWQGTMKAGDKDLRIIFSLYKGERDGWSAKLYSIDQTKQTIPVTSVTRLGLGIKMTVASLGGNFAGNLSADGKSMAGTFTFSSTPFPLILVLATPETAWEIPVAAEPEKPMAADVDPAFDVATIKPNPSGGTSSMGPYLKGRHMIVTNGSLVDILKFAYSLQVKQVVGPPEWAANDRYDVDAVMDQPGTPSVEQIRVMYQKLLADRYSLKVHDEKRNMSAYVLTAGKTGQKLVPAQGKGALPSFYFLPGSGGLTLHLLNGTMADFTSFLQMTVLEKPVVDQTGLAGRFDSNVTFTPDQTQFNGQLPKLPASDVADAPDLFTAIQQQMGLRLAAEKTSVGVVVIDHVEKPSAN